MNKKSVWEDPLSIRKVEPSKEKSPEQIAPTSLPVLNAITQVEISNTKAENALLKKPFSSWLSQDIPGVDVASAKDKQLGRHIPVDMIVSLPSGASLPQGYDLGATDSTILNAASTLSQFTPVFTIAQLVNVMNGDAVYSEVKPATQKEILDRVKYMASIRITIKAAAHQKYNAEKRSRPQLEHSTFTGFLLPANIWEDGISGETYIRLLQQPPLYTYAKETRQIITEKYEMMDLTHVGTKKSPIRYMTPQVRNIRDFFLREINRISKQNKVSGTGPVLYESVYTYLLKDPYGTFDITKKPSKQRVNQNIARVLDVFVGKGKLISWKPEPKGRKKLYRIVLQLP